jgi:putative addiction module CopG family antidote
MTIHLPEDLERFVLDVVRTGRYAHEDDVIRDALIRLQQATPEGAETPVENAEPGRQGKPLTKEVFHRHLVELGLLSQPPDTNAHCNDPDDQLIDTQGEIISETIIRERLIEWLVGFLEK